MKHIKLFESFSTPTVKFDPSLESDYSITDGSGKLSVDANFKDTSYMQKFGPNDNNSVLKLMPNTVESVGYLGHGNGSGWKLTFKPGINFEKAWNSLINHDDSMRPFFQKLIGNISTLEWGFEGLSDMGTENVNGELIDSGIMMVP